MLDEKMKLMLDVANTLTADDLEYLRLQAPAMKTNSENAAPVPAVRSSLQETQQPSATGVTGVPRGEYERQRSRESKISTVCVGQERQKHEWWPLGTELVGRIGNEVFASLVVENLEVKSGRSILITSGSAKGKTCITPTRAALEATEGFRQAGNLGRSGGVTNGWTFWESKQK